MAKTNNTKQAAETAVAVATEPTESTELSAQTDEGFASTITASDIDIPMINVVQKLSESDFPYGSLIVDKRHLLADIDVALDVAVVAAKKSWREDIPYDDDDIPRKASTQAEAELLAADSDYDLIEFAEITYLVRQPEGADDAAYPYPIGDGQYAIGKMNVAKDAYRQTFKRLATFAAFNRTQPVHTRLWTLTSSTITRGKYSWAAPSLTITTRKPDEAVVAFIEAFTN